MPQAGPVSTFTCPNGHPSTASDYCDTCGVPIPAGASAPDPGGASTSAAPESSAARAPDAGPAGSGAPDPQVCPNCGSPKDAAALFCEACGYDFTTGTMPRPLDPSS